MRACVGLTRGGEGRSQKSAGGSCRGLWPKSVWESRLRVARDKVEIALNTPCEDEDENEDEEGESSSGWVDFDRAFWTDSGRGNCVTN